MTTLFVAITLLALIQFYLGVGRYKVFFGGGFLWLLLVGGLALNDAFAGDHASRFAFVLVTSIILSVLLYKRIDFNSVKVPWLVAVHILRVPVELVLYRLSLAGEVPVLMTFKGYNFDLFFGASAVVVLVIIILPGNRIDQQRWFWYWNVIGLAFLTVIVCIAVLSSPLPIQQFAFDQPNVAVLHFPYCYLPSFIVPVVALAHLVLLRKLRRHSQ